MSSPSNTRRAGQGFTLVELLVVISIMAVLVAMLLPAMDKARHAVRELKCLAQLRAVGIGVITYSTDFTDLVPPHFNYTKGVNVMYQGPKAPHTMWAYWAEGPTPFKMRAGLTYPDYIRDTKVFYCPESAHEVNGKARHTDMKFNTSPTGTHTGFKNLLSPVAYSGQFYVDYSFPAVNYGAITQTNYGGYLDVAPNYWDVTNYWQSAATWGTAMVQKRVTDNAGRSYPMMWDSSDGDGQIQHELRVTNIVYFDGVGKQYRDAKHVYDNYSHSIYGAQGFRHPSVLVWLSKFKKEGYTLP